MIEHETPPCQPPDEVLSDTDIATGAPLPLLRPFCLMAKTSRSFQLRNDDPPNALPPHPFPPSFTNTLQVKKAKQEP